MRSTQFLLSPVLLALVGLGAARADEKKVLVGGSPPLTEDMADDYAGFARWRWSGSSAGQGGPDRYRQMVINTWKNNDNSQKEIVLANLKWWREEFPKLSRGERERLPTRDVNLALPSEATADAIHRLKLKLWHDARQREVLGVSDAAAKGHETNMRIIDTYRPSGRYEYNPATGRYDRYVPHR